MKSFKRFLIASLSLLLILAMTGCNASKDAENMDGADHLPEAPQNGAPHKPSAPPVQEDAGENDGAFDELVSGIVENPFISTIEQPISTFSADVDTASYSYFRKLVNQDMTLERLISMGGSFRTEEFINYFRYHAATPQEGELFGVTSEFMDCPWNPDTVLMRLTLQAETAVEQTRNNLVFLIDVSGSMSASDKLPLLKRAFTNLIGQLNEDDVVSIVTYSGKEAVVLDGCAGNQGERILEAIQALRANGSTNGEAGLEKAYQLAEKHYIENGNNRIIMASDGDLNVGISSQSELTAYISQKREAGVFLSVLGFGTGNYRDAKMEALADNGNGVYYYIDGDSEAERVLGSNLFSTLYTVAKDVKLQLTFHSTYISSYRLIGYENRMLNEEDFRDDTKDAGEVGAGHQVTVLYEVKLTPPAYKTDNPWVELGVVYKLPQESESADPNYYCIGASSYHTTPSSDLQFMSCLIKTCMILHNSRYLGDVTLEDVLESLQELDLTDPERIEFRNLITKLVSA